MSTTTTNPQYYTPEESAAMLRAIFPNYPERLWPCNAVAWEPRPKEEEPCLPEFSD
jgi:hypothetical protein